MPGVRVRLGRSFRSRLFGVLLVVGIVPVSLLGWFSYRTSREALARAAGQVELYAAHDLSRFCEKVIADSVDQVKLAATYIPFDELDARELTAVLGIPYRQLSEINLIVVVDQNGKAIAEPVYASRKAPVTGHETLDDVDLEVFAKSVPLAAAVSEGLAIGRPYRGTDATAARLAIAVRVSLEPTRILAAELSLRMLQRRVDDMSRGDDLAWVVDGHGQPLIVPAVAPSESMLAAVRARGATAAPLIQAVSGHDGEEWIAAFVPATRLHWEIIVGQRAATAQRAARRVAALTAFWSGVAVLLALILGAFVARSLSRPVEALSVAAKALTGGDYTRRASTDSEDELGQFAKAFNHMASEVQRRDEEIRQWYDELEKRVEERTAQLKAIQEQVLRSRHLTAIGSLSAGFAHELNNPMTGIIGLLSILSKQTGEDSELGETVTLVLEQARRVAKLVREFQDFADVTSEAHHERVAVTRPAKAALDALHEDASARSIGLSATFEDGMPEVLGDSAQIQQLVTNLVKNAIEATPAGGSVRVSARSVGGEAVEIRVADTGRGIPPELQERIFDPFFSTKDHPGQVGLGLSTSQRIVEAHYGKITLESTFGRGTTFTIFLPVAPKPAHLY